MAEIRAAMTGFEPLIPGGIGVGVGAGTVAPVFTRGVKGIAVRFAF